MNKSVKTFDGLDNLNSPENCLQQIDTHLISTIGEQSLNFIACFQWHKRIIAYVQCCLSEIALRWFLRLQGTSKKDFSAFVSAFKKHFFPQKTVYYAQPEAQVSTNKETVNVGHYTLKVQ